MVLFLPKAAHCDYAHARSPGLLANVPADVGAAKPGHRKVQQYDLWPKRFRDLDRSPAIVHGARRVTRGLKNQGKGIGTLAYSLPVKSDRRTRLTVLGLLTFALRGSSRSGGARIVSRLTLRASHHP